jgi:hypothetical protein
MNSAELRENILSFILGGKAFFTILSEQTQARYTFRVVARKNPNNGVLIHFVSVLNGADNENDYAYMGCILDKKKFVLTGKSRVTPQAKSYLVFTWLFNRLVAGKGLPASVKFYHAGRCGRCGRKLTVPESIETGFGPECAAKGFGG